MAFQSHRKLLATPKGYSWEFFVGVCRPVLRIMILFQTKKCHFPHPFSDLEVVTKCNIRVYIDRNYVIFAEIRTPTKRFLSFLFIYNWNDEHILTLPSSPVNHTRFWTKMGKSYTRFQSKSAPKPYPLGRHITMCLYKGVPPPPPPLRVATPVRKSKGMHGITIFSLKNLSCTEFFWSRPLLPISRW